MASLGGNLGSEVVKIFFKSFGAGNVVQDINSIRQARIAAAKSSITQRAENKGLKGQEFKDFYAKEYAVALVRINKEMGKLRADRQQSARVVAALNRELEGIGSKLPALGALAGYTAIVSTAFAGLYRAVQLFGEQDQAINRLTIAFASMGSFSSKASAEIVSFGKAIQNQSRFTDEAVISAAGLIGQLGRIKGDQLKEATQGAVNLAVALGRDLNVAALIVAKAAQGSTFELRKYGLVIDRNIPKAERFAAVLNFLNTRFGGVAQQELESFNAKVAALFNAFKEWRQLRIEPLVLEVIAPSVDAITEWLKLQNEVLQKQRQAREEQRGFSLTGPTKLFGDMQAAIDSFVALKEEMIQVNSELRELKRAPEAPVAKVGGTRLETDQYFKDLESYKIARDNFEKTGRKYSEEHISWVERLAIKYVDLRESIPTKLIPGFDGFPKVFIPSLPGVDPGIAKAQTKLKELLVDYDELSKRILAIGVEIEKNPVQFVSRVTMEELNNVRNALQEWKDQAPEIYKGFLPLKPLFAELATLLDKAIGESVQQRAEALYAPFANFTSRLEKLSQTGREKILIELDPEFGEIKDIRSELFMQIFRSRGTQEALIFFNTPEQKKSIDEELNILRNEKIKPALDSFAKTLTGVADFDQIDLLPIDAKLTEDKAQRIRGLFNELAKSVGLEALKLGGPPLSLKVFDEILALRPKLDAQLSRAADFLGTRDAIQRLDQYSQRMLELSANTREVTLQFKAIENTNLDDALAQAEKSFRSILALKKPEAIADGYKDLVQLLAEVKRNSPETTQKVSEFLQTIVPGLRIGGEDAVVFGQKFLALAPIIENVSDKLRGRFFSTQEFLRTAKTAADVAAGFNKIITAVKQSGRIDVAKDAISQIRSELKKLNQEPIQNKAEVADLEAGLKRILGIYREISLVNATRITPESIDTSLYATEQENAVAEAEQAIERAQLRIEKRMRELTFGLQAGVTDIPLQLQIELEVQDVKEALRKLKIFKAIQGEIASLNEELTKLPFKAFEQAVDAVLDSVFNKAQSFKDAMVELFRSLVQEVIAIWLKLQVLDFAAQYFDPSGTIGRAIKEAGGRGKAGGDTGQGKAQPPLYNNQVEQAMADAIQNAAGGLASNQPSGSNALLAAQLARRIEFRREPDFAALLPPAQPGVTVNVNANDVTSVSRSFAREQGTLRRAFERQLRYG